MQVEYRTTENDSRKFLIAYYFKRDLARRLTILIVASLWLGSMKENEEPFIFSNFFIKAGLGALFLFLIFTLIPYYFATRRFKKEFDKYSNLEQKITLNEEGILFTVDNGESFWKWETIKNAEIVDDFLTISLYTDNIFLVPLNAFLNEGESINFLATIKSNIVKLRDGNTLRKIRNLHYWGWLGLIPNIGVIAGIIIFIKGIKYKTKSLMLVGVADILFTVIFWMIFFQFLNPDGMQKLSQMQLNNLVKNIEFYKLQNGQYPDSLIQLKREDAMAPINDVMRTEDNQQNNYYQYQNFGDKYLLFSRGEDGIPNTTDDLYPSLPEKDSSKIGYIKSR